jgi:hypothetical protein
MLLLRTFRRIIAADISADVVDYFNVPQKLQILTLNRHSKTYYTGGQAVELEIGICFGNTPTI